MPIFCIRKIGIAQKGQTLMSEQAFFIGDHVALDFLNSIAAPRGEVIESIADGEAYLTWLADAGLLDRAEIPILLERHGGQALDQVAIAAQHLREWFRQVIAKPASARWLNTETIAQLNPILATDNTHRQLEKSGSRLVLRERREYKQVWQLLVPVAHAIAALLTEGDPSLIKRCANPSCTLWFYDRTKAHRRRFCSAAVCGNRAKVAAFRERQRLANPHQKITD